jgi:hypothetical protein
LLGLKAGCEICGDCFWEVDQMVKHYRETHPKDAVTCDDAFGDCRQPVCKSSSPATR